MKDRIQRLDEQFGVLHSRMVELVTSIPHDRLFATPPKGPDSKKAVSSGNLVLRSAGLIEQTFGGITTRLWDDPFEWTLPEELSTKSKMLDYLQLVEKTRQYGFSFFKSETDLEKMIPAPAKLKSLARLLDETISNAERLFSMAVKVAASLDPGDDNPMES